jgi:hypothetical protein
LQQFVSHVSQGNAPGSFVIIFNVIK